MDAILDDFGHPGYRVVRRKAAAETRGHQFIVDPDVGRGRQVTQFELPGGATAEDWPQVGYGPGHCYTTPEQLPAQLHLQWTRQLPAPRPAWPGSQFRLQIDRSYTPVAAGGMLLVPSMVTDSVTAYGAGNGTVRWQFVTDGPVRLAPAVADNRVYIASDDGHACSA